MLFPARPYFRVTLVALLGFASVTYAQQTPTITHTAPTNTDPTSGIQMYRTYCAVCHGVDGTGNGPAAPALKIAPPDLTQLAKKNGGQFPRFRVSNIVTGDAVVTAHGSREMPTWGDVFRSLQRDDMIVKLRVQNLVNYIASIQQK